VPNVTVAGTDVVVQAKGGEAILAALYRHGYAYKIGCRRGGCGVCKVDLVEGEVSYPITVADTVLSADDRAAGTCLSCRAVPETDVVIALTPDDQLRCVAPLLSRLLSTHKS
jgi:CDP-4-dehydro-6-deoxyglucose reductase